MTPRFRLWVERRAVLIQNRPPLSPLALQKLGDHLGLFASEKKDTIVDRVRKMTPEQRVARFEEIMRIARERYGHLIEHELEEQDSDDALDTDTQSGGGAGH
jgi:hypothetical protein